MNNSSEVINHYEYPDYELDPLATPKPYSYQISTFGWLSLILYSLVFVLGVLGNGLVMWVTTFEMKRTVNTVWFFNLAVADLLCCFCSPFSIMRLALGYWPLGLYACKFIPSMLLVNMFASVFLLTVISIDRCALVLKPVWCQNNRNVTKAYLACLVLWILAFVLSSPAFVFRITTELENGNEQCSQSYASAGNHKQKVENTVAILRFMLGFVIPFVVITACYSVLMIKVRVRFSQSTKTLKLVLIVISGFFVCWLPYHVAGIILAFNSPSSELYRSTAQVDPLLIAIAFTNSCINPIIYVLVGQEFKTKFKRSFRSALKNVLLEETSDSMQSKKTKSLTETRNTDTLL